MPPGSQYYVFPVTEQEKRTDVRVGLPNQLQSHIRERHNGAKGEEVSQYRVQSIDLLRLRRLISPTVRTVRTKTSTTSEKAGGRRAAGGCWGANGSTQGANLRLGGALARLPRGLERLVHVLHLLPCRWIPRLELDFVRLNEHARVLHAWWWRAYRTVGYGNHRGSWGCAAWRGELSHVYVRIELGEQVLLLLLLRGIAGVVGLLGLLLLIAVAWGCLLRWIVSILAL